MNNMWDLHIGKNKKHVRSLNIHEGMVYLLWTVNCRSCSPWGFSECWWSANRAMENLTLAESKERRRQGLVWSYSVCCFLNNSVKQVQTSLNLEEFSTDIFPFIWFIFQTPWIRRLALQADFIAASAVVQPVLAMCCKLQPGDCFCNFLGFGRWSAWAKYLWKKWLQVHWMNTMHQGWTACEDAIGFPRWHCGAICKHTLPKQVLCGSSLSAWFLIDIDSVEGH